MISDEEREEIERLMEAEAEEARSFMRQHGVVLVEEKRDALCWAVGDDKVSRLVRVHDQLYSLEQEIRDLPGIQRLHGLRQLGGKINPQHAGYNPDQPFVVRPAFHTRFDHSELLAEQSTVAGVSIGLPLEDIAHLMCAGWFHDVGHSAFSHCGDEFLVARGRPGHEERGVAILRSPGVKSMLENYGIDVEKVFEIIKEKGTLGTLQKMFDTLSYLSLDSAMMQDSVFSDYGASLIKDIVGVDGEMLVVSSVDKFQYLLEQRAQRYKDVYYHPVNKRLDESLRTLMRIAGNRGLLQPAAVESGDDHTIHAYLQSLIQRDRGAAMISGRISLDGKGDGRPYLHDCQDLFAMTFGAFNRERWQVQRYTPEELSRIDEFFFKHRKNKKVMEQSFVAEPYDYTKKSLTVMTEDGRVHKLRSNTVELRDEDRCYFLYAPKP